MKRVLVTGASGFIGGHLVPALAREGFEVRGLVRGFQAAKAVADAGGRPVLGNLEDTASLKSALAGVGGVIHLAARVSVHDHERAELERVNVEGTRRLLAACEEAGVRRFVHASSVVAVGARTEPGPPLHEGSENLLRRFNFANCETKSRAEAAVLAACARGAVDAVVVNPSMVFGAGDARKAPRKGSVLAARGRLAYCPRGGVSAVGVRDVVGGVIAAYHRGRAGQRYILSGENLSLRELLGLYARCAGARAPGRELPSWVLRGAGRASRLLRGPLSYEGAMAATLYHWFDHAKARDELGFRPEPVLGAIRESVAWMREQGYLEGARLAVDSEGRSDGNPVIHAP